MKNESSNKNGLVSTAGLILGPLCFIGALLFIEPETDHPHMAKMAAITLLMAIWWMTEAIPLAATALMPLALFPLLGIMGGKAVAPIYMNRIIFLFVGGFLIAIAMEKWALNRRIALWIIRLVGSKPSRIIMGYMGATAFLSMWISNTATVVMMVPMGLAIILKLEEEFGKKETHQFSVCLMLGLAYSASLGGAATLIGTPPNLSFTRIFEISFPHAPTVTFANWMMMVLPLSVFLIILTWFLLTKLLYRPGNGIKIDKNLINEEYRKLGPIGFEETVVLAVSATTACLWIFRVKIPLGFITIPGWSEFLPYPHFIDDGTVAITMALLLFFIPTKGTNSNNSGSILEMDCFQKLPWHIIILFGGGFALAQGIQNTGLSEFIARKFDVLAGTPPLFVIMAVSATITMLTELTSNTATTEITLPILASVAVAMKANPLLLMIPATISASFAFMMPVATPPNAIVFGSGRVRIGEMVRAGIILNVVSVVSVTFVVYFMGSWVFGIDAGVFPEWALKR